MSLSRSARSVAVLLFAAGLSACASGGPAVSTADLGTYHRGLSCAPFARALSGVELRGDAGSWWEEAEGRYVRSRTPEVGAVLVLRPTSRLPDGHVAVVSRLLAPRQVLLTQANWVPERLTEDQLAVDVSPDNDWTEVRLWWPPTGSLGIRAYPAYGFILPPRPASHAMLARSAGGAADEAVAPQRAHVTFW